VASAGFSACSLRAVARATTRPAAKSGLAWAAAATAWVPAEVRWTRTRPARSQPAIAVGELERGMPGTGSPSTSADSTEPGMEAWSALASSTVFTRRQRPAPAARA